MSDERYQQRQQRVKE
ncbi:TPA: hypothetical protein ACUKX5_004207, partial [Escherichia coli]